MVISPQRQQGNTIKHVSVKPTMYEHIQCLDGGSSQKLTTPNNVGTIFSESTWADRDDP